ncbi:glycoside hydrolase 68 family protein [Burkholderia ubonensis]|uniref:Glycoside hydrolase family 68 protein n=2 Tax=Burkholderia ubonensis TaxID=101571 RepID=A0AB74D605_9BURK|nr:glycoside hydrolase family 68 protein [Burkholderia ubonensis]PAJ81550.1 glycoside hydrolase 68 family protein [Burkholderia ubonensis]PAJ89428.1 glycoside hydrolase 68 family protein [Burkholderia ubonensis]PAJ95899.1 glycoside hydrolase 68 family protein [Burkholderia ubonensis]PAK01029.1 glycoside hydrolase 68 family protein [Burkholderia ubonensis]PAK03515.1 glycoside hydrolase 68 family protein [Burkholderia ubonensis]
MMLHRRSPRIRSASSHSLADAVSSALLIIAASHAHAQFPGPAPTPHSQQAFDPTADFTSRWTRADARQIKVNSLVTTVGGNSLPPALTMPNIPANFPDTNADVWVWDTWPIADVHAVQLSYKGWDVIFSLTADRHGGYSFDDRHVHARIGFFYRKTGIPASQRPANGGWIFGGHLFPDGASIKVFPPNLPITENAEWSGSARLTDGVNLSIYYTALAFNKSSPNGPDITPPVAIISRADGHIHADATHVWFDGFNDHIALLQPDGVLYQNGAQNNFYNFRDPYVFVDPAHPGNTYMVFEGNTAGVRGARNCTAADLGYAPGDPYAETVAAVNASGAVFQKANVGLAIATNPQLTAWKFLPPILSANCVDDQTERPQIYLANGKYYLFTITHRSTYATGVDGPDGVMGFVGNGIRSDFLPMNQGGGLVLGNPTDLTQPVGAPFALDPNQNPRTFQSYSHYVMPGGLVESFIDAIGPRRGGSLAPTVKINIGPTTTAVDTTYGTGGLGGYGDISANQPALGRGGANNGGGSPP